MRRSIAPWILLISMLPGAAAATELAGVRLDDRVTARDGTEIRINGQSAGTIDGGGFFRALLAVFLGPEPPDSDLRRGMLGQR